MKQLRMAGILAGARAEERTRRRESKIVRRTRAARHPRRVDRVVQYVRGGPSRRLIRCHREDRWKRSRWKERAILFFRSSPESHEGKIKYMKVQEEIFATVSIAFRSAHRLDHQQGHGGRCIRPFRRGENHLARRFDRYDSSWTMPPCDHADDGPSERGDELRNRRESKGGSDAAS